MMTTELPKDLRPCETCGHDPEEAKRLHYLAGCLDDHEVHLWFDINYLCERVAHVWANEAYAAVQYDVPLRFDGDKQARLLTWLDKCHAGQTPRHERTDSFAPLVFEVLAQEASTDGQS